MEQTQKFFIIAIKDELQIGSVEEVVIRVLLDFFNELVEGVMSFGIDYLFGRELHNFEIRELKVLVGVFLIDYVCQFHFLFLVQLPVRFPRELKQLGDTFPHQLLNTVVGLQCVGNVHDLHHFEVQIVSSVAVQRLHHLPVFTPLRMIAAPEHIVNHQFPQVVQGAELGVLEIDSARRQQVLARPNALALLVI